MKIRVGRTKTAVVHVRRVLLAMALLAALGALGWDHARRSAASPCRSEESAVPAPEEEPGAPERHSPYRAIPVRDVVGHLRLFPDLSDADSWALFTRFRDVRSLEFDPHEAGNAFARLDTGEAFTLLASPDLAAQDPTLILHLQPSGTTNGISQGTFRVHINGKTLKGFYALSYG